MSRVASVFVADPNTKDVAELAHHVAALFQVTLIEHEGEDIYAKRCPWRLWLHVDDSLELSCDICIWDRGDRTYFANKQYSYCLDIHAAGFKPGEYEEATIRCGQFIFDKLKVTGRYSRLLLVLDFGTVIDEFDASSD